MNSKRGPHTGIESILPKEIFRSKKRSDRFDTGNMAKELREEDKYRLFVHNFQGIAFQSTLDLKPIFVHGDVEEITGYSKEYFLSESFNWDKLVHPEDHSGFRKTVKKLRLRSNDTHQWEFRIIHKHGQVRWVKLDIQKVRDDSGASLLIQGVINDITDLKEANRLLAEQRVALERKNIALSEVLEQVAHEKKQIIDNIIANAENLLLPVMEKLRVKGVARGYVDLLEKNLRELTLSFGQRIGDKRAKLTPREIAISNMIKSGLESKEIANLLNLSLHTIEKHRLHIRRKLSVRKGRNLTTFLQSL